MPKAKIKKSIARRVKITKTGKVLREAQHSRHRKAHKSKTQIKSYKKKKEFKGKVAKMIKKILYKQ